MLAEELSKCVNDDDITRFRELLDNRHEYMVIKDTKYQNYIDEVLKVSRFVGHDVPFWRSAASFTVFVEYKRILFELDVGHIFYEFFMRPENCVDLEMRLNDEEIKCVIDEYLENRRSS